jgi:transposase
MDEINKVRKAYFTLGESKNAIAKRFKRSWETIDRIV